MELRPIGIVRSPVVEPIDSGWGDVLAELHLSPELAPGLIGLEEYSHVVVVTHLHRTNFDPAEHLIRRPRERADAPPVGVFAHRSRHRPNAIGITSVALIGVQGPVVTVRGLDAVDGTPVLDLKPYVPVFDRVVAARVPAWVDPLFRGYF